MIREGFRRAPNAAYALVQTVLVQDEALKAANAHIQEYEQQYGAPQQQAGQPRGFLDNVRDSIFGRDEPRGSVPRVPQGGAPMGAPSPWAQGGQGGLSARRLSARRLSAGRADAGAAAGWRRRLVPRHRGGRRGRHDRRLAADGRHPLGDGRAWRLEPGRGRVRLTLRARRGSFALRNAGGGDLAREAGLDDIGRGRSGGDAGEGRRAGLFDSADNSEGDSEEYEDDGDAGYDDGGDSDDNA